MVRLPAARYGTRAEPPGEMMEQITTLSALERLHNSLAIYLPRQITDSGSPDLGAYVDPEWELPSPTHTATSALLGSCALLSFAAMTNIDRPIDYSPVSMLERAVLAADYLLAVQLDNGRIDNRRSNYNAGSAAAFICQQLCGVIELCGPAADTHDLWGTLLERIERFVRKAVPGILSGGFHTPNHRWVIAMALAQAAEIFPDMEEAIKPGLESYLAELPDVDMEGAWMERSVGIYDAACDRAMLILNEKRGYKAGLDAARANLDFNLYLLHADHTAETGLSYRQDAGSSTVPVSLCPCYLQCAALDPNPIFTAAAGMLWSHEEEFKLPHLFWTAYTLLKYGDPGETTAGLPDNYSRFFPNNGLWRVRRDLMSLSVFGNTGRLIRLRFGEAELLSLSIAQSYFGVGDFKADSFLVEENEAILLSENRRNPHRPGFDMPLGVPVPPADWEGARGRREIVQMPLPKSELRIKDTGDGLDLVYRTTVGWDGVVAQVAFDFPPGGTWETADTRVRPMAGQSIFLKQGTGRMRYGCDVIEIGPGSYAGAFDYSRGTESQGNQRIVFTFSTPVDHRFSIRAYRGLPA